VEIDTAEFAVLAAINPEVDRFRPFQGQSPFLVNAILSYYSEKAKLGIDVSYNIFGKRLAAIGLNGLPDVYDQPRGLLNLAVKKQVGEHFGVQCGVANLLDSEYVTEQAFKNNVYLNESHRTGPTYSFGISYFIK
jgi:hypothetical protein